MAHPVIVGHNFDVLDLHNHVLYGLDDGCRHPRESAALAEAMKAAGHDAIVATPHIRPGVFDNDPDGIRQRRDDARALVEAAGLELHLGAEYYFSPELLDDAKGKRLLTLGETSRFVLVELPRMGFPPRLDALLYEIRLTGYVPVIAHPERCRAVSDDPAWAVDIFTQAGVLLQLDLGSLVGHYGRTAQRTANDLVDRGVYHAAACDLHRPEDVAKVVAPSLKALIKRLKKRRAETKLDELIRGNPRRILDDVALEDIAPV